jgi:hypothetical protein
MITNENILPPFSFEAYKKTAAEKIALANAKAKHREQLRNHYGPNWKKYINVPNED